MESWRRGEEGITSVQPFLFPLRRRDAGGRKKTREFARWEQKAGAEEFVHTAWGSQAVAGGCFNNLPPACGDYVEMCKKKAKWWRWWWGGHFSLCAKLHFHGCAFQVQSGDPVGRAQEAASPAVFCF